MSPSFHIKQNIPENEKNKEWSSMIVGQLPVDIFQTENELIIYSTVAGIKKEDLEISVEDDRLLIRGERKNPAEKEKNKDYFCQECFWGLFSKEIILPVETDPSRIEAEMEKGILIIKIPKISKEKKKIIVK